jgi:hypothetical protein
MWYKVAEGTTAEELQANIPAKYQQVPVGKRIQVIRDCTPFPVAPLFDLAGAEFAAQLFQHQGKLIDVSGSGAFKIIFEIEAADTGSASQLSAEDASMAWTAMQVGAIILVCAALPLITRLFTLFANYIPSPDGSTGGGLMDWFTALFGDYTPYVLIGGAVILFLLLKPGKGGSAPIIYNITGKKRESESED